MNVVQFAILFNYDLRHLLYDVGRARGTWGANLYARILALTLYECSEDFTELLGKDFRTLVVRLGGDESDMRRLGELHAAVSSFFRSNLKLLKALRTEVTGHRDKNADVQLARLQALDVAQVEELGYDLLRWVTELHAYVGGLIGRLTNR